MRAITFQGTGKVQVGTVDDPALEQPTDVLIRVTSTAICGSGLLPDLSRQPERLLQIGDEALIGPRSILVR